MNNNIYSTFLKPEMAEKAAGALLDYGVKSEHISIIFPEGYAAGRDLKNDSHVKDPQRVAEKGITTTTAGDAESGAAKGAGIGLAVGVLSALASVFVPGVGLVVGGGALAMAIGGAAGATAAGAVAGGLTGYLKDQGVPSEHIGEYSSAIGTGGALLTVTPIDEKVSAEKIRSVIVKYDGTVRVYSDTASPVS